MFISLLVPLAVILSIARKPGKGLTKEERLIRGGCCGAFTLSAWRLKTSRSPPRGQPTDLHGGIFDSSDIFFRHIKGIYWPLYMSFNELLILLTRIPNPWLTPLNSPGSASMKYPLNREATDLDLGRFEQRLAPRMAADITAYRVVGFKSHTRPW